MPSTGAHYGEERMNNTIACRIFCLAIVLVILVWAPQPALASGMHGGGGFHGGGGGFHGGGGGFHGGSNFAGAYHGGGYGWHGGGSAWHGGGSAWHGGGYYGGWRGAYWGFPGWGYGGWRFSIGFNFGPFWGGFPYVWAPAPPFIIYYPVPVPFSGPAAYTSADAYPNNQGGGNAYNGGYQLGPPGQRSVAPIPTPAPATNSLTIRDAAYTPAARNHSTMITAASNTRPINSSARRLPAPRPEVQNVIRALRAMPPAARQREIDSGRYSNLTPQELEFAKYAAGLQPSPPVALLTSTN